jgi:mono/diheme cytochrome c family protein
MHLSKLILALVVSCLPAFAYLGAAQEVELDRAAASRGRETFNRFCSTCHGRQAKGDGPLAKDLKAKPADLTGLSERNGGTFPYQMVIDTISKGRRLPGHGAEDMPAWGKFLREEGGSDEAAKAKMDELAQFLWSLQPKRDQ